MDCNNLITSIVDNITVTVNDSVKISDVNDGVPLDSFTTSAYQTHENSQFCILPWITFHILYVSINMRFFSI